jgi:hypothetical protein
MKRVLLIAALVAPTWLYSCMPKSVVPDPAAIVQETFDKLPPVPAVRDIPIVRGQEAPVLPSYKPKAKPHAPVGSPTRTPVPHHRPAAPKAPVAQGPAPLPPQQGVICVFPLNMVPNCTPEPAGRMP